MPSTELAALVAKHWRQLPAAARCVRVGLSGGLDSTVLLHLLAGLRGELGFGLSAAHVRHGLVPGSEAWADVCAEVCAALHVPLAVHDVHVDRAHPGGLEAAAREARRAALLSQGSAVLALAHHCDDQAETVLFRALRGAGVKGAAGMRAFVPVGAEGGLWRPLLDVPRAVLHAYAVAHQLRWIDDPSNADSRFARNFLRNSILPQIETRFPAASAGLARLGRLCGEADGLLDELADMDLATLRIASSPQLLRVPALQLSSARLRNLMRRLLALAGVAMPDEDRLREVERQFRETTATGARLLFGEVALCTYRERWWLEPCTVTVEAAPRVWHGEASLPWGSGVLSFESSWGEGLAARLMGGESCRIGLRSPGGRMRLRRGGPSRSLKNLWQEAGIPPWLRDAVPVLWVGDSLAWIAGVGVAAEFQCPEGEAGIVPAWSVFA